MSTAFRPVRHRYEDALSRLSWRDFQRRIAGHFEGAGYVVEQPGVANDADRGIDLVLRRGDETIVVTCKHWSAFQVPHEDVHRLLGQMPVVGATSGLLITSGEFTRTAIDAAARFRHVRLVDGRALRALLGPVEDLRPFRLPPPDSPIWAPVTSTPEAGRREPASRAATIAAVAAMLVLAVAMLTLYTWYIRDAHDIHASQGDVAGPDRVYRHAGAAPAPPPFAPPPRPPGTGAEP
jgi:hypothetical protein